MKRRKKKLNHSLIIKERIEDFLYSDSIPATTTKFLLMCVAVSSIAFGGAVLPGILVAIKELNMLSNGKNKYSKGEISNAINRLKREKYIEIIEEGEEKMKVKLTNKGEKRIAEFSLEAISIKKPKKWDGKWRIVIFDIPNRYKPAREALRNKMKELGFKKLQKSVWIYPFECEDEILFIAEVFAVERYVEIITAERLLHENILKDAFKTS